MKNLHVLFNDDDYELLETAKPQGMNWRQFILTLVTPKKKK